MPSIERTVLFRNLLPSKLINVRADIAAFSNFHFEAKEVEGNLMPKIIISEDTAFASFSFRDFPPKAEVKVHFKVLVERRTLEQELDFNRLSQKQRLKIQRIFSYLSSRKLENVAVRLWRKSGGDPQEFAREVSEFLNRNLKKVDSVFDTWEDVFAQKYGGCGDFALAFRILAGLVGIPTRFVCGFVQKGASWKEHIWVQLGDSVSWLDVDPFECRIGFSENYFPILIHERLTRPLEYRANYKILRKMLKRGLDVLILTTLIKS